MKTEKRRLQEIINEPLKDAGFQRKTNSWYLHTTDVILVVNLQKCDFGHQYYINFGVAVKEFCKDHFPKENHCHIRFRLEALVDLNQVNELRSYLDLENVSINEETRKTEIINLLRDKALPRLNKLSAMSGIKELKERNLLNRTLVHKLVNEKLLAS